MYRCIKSLSHTYTRYVAPFSSVIKIKCLIKFASLYSCLNLRKLACSAAVKYSRGRLPLRFATDRILLYGSHAYYSGIRLVLLTFPGSEIIKDSNYISCIYMHFLMNHFFRNLQSRHSCRRRLSSLVFIIHAHQNIP